MAKHAAPVAPEPEHVVKSRKLKRKLIVIIVLLVAAIAALIVAFGYFLQDGADKTHTDVQSQQTDVETIQGGPKTDASTTTAAATEIPNLVGLFGMTQDEALSTLAHGATVTSSKTLSDDSDAKGEATITLADEPADARSGAPKVYLTYGNDDKIKRAGYSAALSSLGYGTLSFQDVITQEHVIESSLRAAGLSIEDGAVQLPEDSSYATYADDGKTLTRETMSFKGTADANGQSKEWEAVIYYDYVTANTTGKLSDTVRQIYIYIND